MGNGLIIRVDIMLLSGSSLKGRYDNDFNLKKTSHDLILGVMFAVGKDFHKLLTKRGRNFMVESHTKECQVVYSLHVYTP